MSDPVLEANKALVLAHYDAVTNSHDPDAIRAQVTSDFYDHGAGKAMSADEVIAHSAAMHATFGELQAAVESMWPKAIRSPRVWSGAGCTRGHGAASRHQANVLSFAA